MNRNLLLALTALLPMAAYSAPVTYTQGDLLMGFRVTGGDGVGQYYVVDIGPSTTFRNATGPVTLSLGNLGADLSALYTPAWHDRADLTWSIAATSSNVETGINGDPEDTLYFSKKEETAGVPAAAWKFQSRTLRGTSANQLQNMQDTFKSFYTATVNSPSATIQSDSDPTAATIYSAYIHGGRSSTSNLDFAAFNTIESDVAHTVSLFRLPDQNAGAYLGSFSLSSGGVLTFTPGATTPPSAYSTWAQANVGGQGPSSDFDGDGISNGLEYFMGTAPNAPTATVAPSGGSITWPRSATAQVTSFKVESSTDLVNWTDVTTGATVTTTSITYPLAPTTAKTFVRLSVDVPQN